jgi:protein-S-isoprenylcysteine O-methyltransferase Ste14
MEFTPKFGILFNTGVQLAFWGLSLWFASLVGFVLTLVLVLPMHIWRARAEERVLVEAFGSEYENYKARTWL